MLTMVAYAGGRDQPSWGARLLPSVDDAVGPGPLLGRQLTAGAGQCFAERRAPSRSIVESDVDGVLDEAGDRERLSGLDEPAYAVNGRDRQGHGDLPSSRHVGHDTDERGT